jgi:hypothetical protein
MSGDMSGDMSGEASAKTEAAQAKPRNYGTSHLIIRANVFSGRVWITLNRVPFF